MEIPTCFVGWFGYIAFFFQRKSHSLVKFDSKNGEIERCKDSETWLLFRLTIRKFTVSVMRSEKAKIYHKSIASLKLERNYFSNFKISFIKTRNWAKFYFWVSELPRQYHHKNVSKKLNKILRKLQNLCPIFEIWLVNHFEGVLNWIIFSFPVNYLTSYQCCEMLGSQKKVLSWNFVKKNLNFFEILIFIEKSLKQKIRFFKM